MNMHNRESLLNQVLNSGFAKSADSFSRLINRGIKITNSKSSLIRNNDTPNLSEAKGDLHVMITRIIGDVTGKSFLICNEEEYKEILGTLNMSVEGDELNSAFLVEIDNIVSAPVIAELSTMLNLEVYGDVPQMSKVHSSEINSFILGEVIKDDPCSIITHATFQFDNKKIHPQFIWKLSSKILDLIPDTLVSR